MTKSVEFPQCAHLLEVNYCLEVLIAHLRNIPLLSGYGIKRNFKQECIPVGCVPPAAVAVHQAAPRTRHLPWDQAPPSPCGQTHTCKHITLPQTSFAGGKNLKSIRSTQLVTTGTWHSTVNYRTNITDEITFVTSSVLISWTTLQPNWCKNLPST